MTVEEVIKLHKSVAEDHHALRQNQEQVHYDSKFFEKLAEAWRLIDAVLRDVNADSWDLKVRMATPIRRRILAILGEIPVDTFRVKVPINKKFPSTPLSINNRFQGVSVATDAILPVEIAIQEIQSATQETNRNHPVVGAPFIGSRTMKINKLRMAKRRMEKMTTVQSNENRDDDADDEEGRDRPTLDDPDGDW